ncbi:MAG: LpqB family beta-propeller domain-containing protein [Gordonia sp. (in: high G+C Gram-positive bacteria)]|uniref:LpqB family beta-propeller domain-containing protein n=1 Tax=Gordonia sp. (in: high G+C Gram-positive bacteria) TaxID=84139 RepID=UPI0039E64514
MTASIRAGRSAPERRRRSPVDPVHRTPPFRRRRRGVLAVLLVACLALTGCVAIPDSSSPQPVEEFRRTVATNLVPTPGRSDDPETLVRNFIKAMADPADGHRAARKFLTRGGSDRWDDQGEKTVLNELRVVVDERNESAVRLRVIGDRIGVLSSIGRLLPATGKMILPLILTRSGDRWRIAGDVPPGTITDATQFDATFRAAQVYFPDRTQTRLAGDPRWLFGAAVDPTELVSHLLAGPAPSLAGAVETAAGKDLELRGPVVHEDDTITVNLGGLGEADTRARTVLAAQLIWTLDEAGLRGTYMINVDGGALIPERADGWRTADVQAFDPEPESGEVSLHVVRHALLRVAPSGTTPVGGPLGTADDLVSAAISADQARVAAVAERGGRRVLLQGLYGGEVSEVIGGAEIHTPSFGARTDVGYALVDGRPIQWTVDPGRAGESRPRVVSLDISRVAAVEPGRITAFKVSPDGVRAALIVGGSVLFAALSTNDRGVPALTGVYVAAPDVGAPAVSIAWGGVATVYLARNDDDAPIMRVPVSGLPATALVSGNLKPPVRALAATRSKVYVGDSRTVMELGTASGSPDQYWTEVGRVAWGSVPVAQAG